MVFEEVVVFKGGNILPPGSVGDQAYAAFLMPEEFEGVYRCKPVVKGLRPLVLKGSDISGHGLETARTVNGGFL